MAGCARWNDGSRGSSQPTANVPTTATVTTWRCSPPSNCSSTECMRSKLSVSSGSSAWPSSVRASPRGRRRNSGVPSRVSRFFTCALTAFCVTCSSSAARVKLRWRAAASKARIAFNGSCMTQIIWGLCPEISV